MSIASEIQRLQTSKASIKTSIINKGVTVPDSANIDTYSTYIDQIETGGGGGSSVPDVWEGVNFLDYDGTNIAAYGTYYVLQQLSALPDPPAHTGLTFNGWSWTLQQIKNYLTSYPKAQLFIGPKYSSTDTHIFITLPSGSLSPYLNFKYTASSSATIDWGDGTTSTLGTASSATLISRRHNYSIPGDYEIKIQNVSKFIGYGGAGGFSLLSATQWTTSASSYRNADQVYQSCVKGVWLQSNSIDQNQAYLLQRARNCQFFLSNGMLTNTATGLCRTDVGIRRCAFDKPSAQNMFYNSYQVKVVAIPRGDTSIGANHFLGTAVQSISIPDTISTLEASVFQNCYSLQKVIIPSSVTSIQTSDFQNCYSLAYVDLPSGITNIAANAFTNCYGLNYVLFRSASAPTLADSTVFSNLPTTCRILVPMNSFTSYYNKSNYPSTSTYTYSIFATYASGATLPNSSGIFSSIQWYASIRDLIQETSQITTGNGQEIYGKVIYGSTPASGLTLTIMSASSEAVQLQLTGSAANTVYYKYNTTMPNVGSTLDNSWKAATVYGIMFNPSAPAASGSTIYVVTLNLSSKVDQGGSKVITFS